VTASLSRFALSFFELSSFNELFFLQQLSSFNNSLPSTTLFLQQLSSFNNSLPSTTLFLQQLSSSNNSLPSRILFLQQLLSFNNFLPSTIFGMMVTGCQKPVETEKVENTCGFPLCAYNKTGSALRQHIARHHTDITVTVGSFFACGFAEFNEAKPSLRCSNCQMFYADSQAFYKHLYSMKCPWCKPLLWSFGS
jgi:hypothetical protein